jgi:hypothetical protein
MFYINLLCNLFQFLFAIKGEVFAPPLIKFDMVDLEDWYVLAK